MAGLSVADPSRRTHLVGLLAFTSGGVDVVTLMTLGGAFTSVITGNLIFTGRAVGTSALTPAVHAILAVAGYIVGVAAGSRLREAAARGAPKADWPRAATLVLLAEWMVLLAVNVAWIGYGAAPPPAATDLMLTAAAVSLGMQGAATRSIAGNPSTTYMTGALTALVEALATGRHRAAGILVAAVGLAGLVAGAACGAVLVEHATRFALLLPLASLALVVAIKVRHHRAEGDDADGRRTVDDRFR
jgi:uncharacterized membrane protein YoaK (UPF0700 family)